MTLSNNIDTISTALDDIHDAIVAKGVTPSGNITTYATAIGQISGGGSATINPLSVTPSTTAQTITASGGVDGYSPISVSAVTSAIDSNIVAGNIKDGVTILGVTGDYSGGGSGQTGAIFLQQGSWQQEIGIKGEYIRDVIGFKSVSGDLISNGNTVTGTFVNGNQCTISLQSNFSSWSSGVYYVGVRMFNTSNGGLTINISNNTENVIDWGKITYEYGAPSTMIYELYMTAGKWAENG